MSAIRKENPDILQRFLNFTSPKEEGCWDWLGSDNGTGYGKFWFKGKQIYAHRMSYLLFYGNLPDNKLVCHSCDNRGCVNPNHLWLGSTEDNMSDMVNKGRSSKYGNKIHSYELIDQIRNLYKTGKYLQKDLSKKFNICKAHIHRIVHNKQRIEG